mmetsp:Transcript_4878/g.11632  ORF Transcript_4878/g.11632 Transcript_4878/m.11632 type:complete len:312 (+) Transcript_4878:1546-2481(+)
MENEIGVNVFVFSRPDSFRDKGSSRDAPTLAIFLVLVIIQGFVVQFAVENGARRIIQGTIVRFAKFARSLVMWPPVILASKIGPRFANLLPDRSTDVIHVKECLFRFGRIHHDAERISKAVTKNFRTYGTIGSTLGQYAPALPAGNSVVSALECQGIVQRDTSVVVQTQNSSVKIGEVLGVGITTSVSCRDIEFPIVAKFDGTSVVIKLFGWCSLHEHLFRLVHDAECFRVHFHARKSVAGSKDWILQTIFRMRGVINVQPVVFQKVWMRDNRLESTFTVGAQLVFDVENRFGRHRIVGIRHDMDVSALHA